MCLLSESQVIINMESIISESSQTQVQQAGLATNPETNLSSGFKLPDDSNYAADNKNGNHNIDGSEFRAILAKLYPIAKAIESGQLQLGDVQCEQELKAIQKNFPEVTLESLRISLKKIVKELIGNDDDKLGLDLKLADILVNMAIEKGCELFHDCSGTTYATIPIDDHKETWKLHSRGFKQWLRFIWLKHYGVGVSAQVVTDAIDTLDAKASLEGDEHEIHLRVAHSNGSIYVDMSNDPWQAVEITSSGWQIIDRVPVKIVRLPGMLPLPMPVSGGQPSEKIAKLKDIINAPADETWKPIVAWLLNTFSEGPFAVLATLGEQGSAKSFVCRILRRLVDPSEAEVTTAPKYKRDVIVAAQNSHVVALDNLSDIPAWLSDLLCGIATGTASRERKLFTNDEEALFKAKRPIMLNGIDLAMKNDLADRTFLISLPVISEDKRQEEKEILNKFEKLAPEILGGIFDVLVDILKNLPNTKLNKKPRMADVAKWVTAAEEALGWKPGDFESIYTANRNNAVELALESDAFGTALCEIMEVYKEWTGGWQQLLDLFGKDTELTKTFPRSAKAVATRLKRLAPALRHFGIHYRHERSGRSRFYHVWKQVSHPSQATNTSDGDNPGGGGLLREGV